MASHPSQHMALHLVQPQAFLLRGLEGVFPLGTDFEKWTWKYQNQLIRAPWAGDGDGIYVCPGLLDHLKSPGEVN